MEKLAEIVQGLMQEKSGAGSFPKTKPRSEEPANRAQPSSEKTAPFITFPVSVGLLEGKHVEAMGIAVWCFLWCINRVTSDRTDPDGERWGQVLGGCRFNQQRIADELGLTVRSVRYQMDRLKTAGYLRITRCRDGQQVEVRHSIKWLRRKTQLVQTNRTEAPPPDKKPPEDENTTRTPETVKASKTPVAPESPETAAPQIDNEPAKVFSLAEALRRKQWEREQGLRG